MRRLRITSLLFPLLVLVLMVASCTSIPAQVTSQSTTTTKSATTTTTTTTMPVLSPPIIISLDYFGVRDTHWIPQLGGGPLTKIQLIVVVSDEKGTLAVWPPPNVQNLTFDMDYFQVEALKEKMNPPVVFNGSITGTLVVYVAAYNISKGEIAKSQIDIISKWLGFPDLNKLKDAIPGRELVGYYWQTWSPSSNWGIGGNYEGGDSDLKVWLRIGSGQMPEPAEQPTLKPNVKIESVTLPLNAKPGFLTYPIILSLVNKEQLDITINWQADSSITGKFDSGTATIPKNGRLDIKKYYSWETGNRTITYTVYYKNTKLDVWSGVLNITP